MGHGVGTLTQTLEGHAGASDHPQTCLLSMFTFYYVCRKCFLIVSNTTHSVRKTRKYHHLWMIRQYFLLVSHTKIILGRSFKYFFITQVLMYPIWCCHSLILSCVQNCFTFTVAWVRPSISNQLLFFQKDCEEHKVHISLAAAYPDF